MSVSRSAVDNFRSLFWRSDDEQEYAPLDDDVDARDDELSVVRDVDPVEVPFSWLEYSVFLLLGVAMLWAWNMFLAAAPYFQIRFAQDQYILAHFQSAITSVFSITNLASMLLLSNLQAKASYTKRIIFSLVLNTSVFTLLSISTTLYRETSATAYLVFTLLMVFATAVAAGLCQNGAFAFASSFGRSEYIQAIMTGQAVAGVLPAIAQILSVLAVPEKVNSNASSTTTISHENTSALIYFITATAISAACLVAVLPLVRKHNRIVESKMGESVTSVEQAEQSMRKVVSMMTLYKKLYWLTASVFLCFMITMFFPVFTQKILSVAPTEHAPRLLQPSAFIPLGLLVWNVGDLIGRLSTLLPFSHGARPPFLFVFAILRAGFIPLYFLCNIGGHGAVIKSDVFYLLVVQLFFGITNGWLGSKCMMDAVKFVDDSEREATGGFMAVNLVAGLVAGSLLSFTVADVK